MDFNPDDPQALIYSAWEQQNCAQLIVDNQDNVIYVNAIICDWLKTPASDLQGIPLSALLHSDSPQPEFLNHWRQQAVGFQQRITVVCVSGAEMTFDTRIFTHQQQRHLLLSHTAAAGVARTPGGFAGILACVPDGLLQINPAGKVSYANPEAKAWLGMADQRLLDMPLEALAAQSTIIHSLANSINSVLHTGYGLQGLVRDDDENYLQFQLVPDAEAGQGAVLLHLHEVTSHVQTEQKLHHAHQQLRQMTQNWQQRMERERKHLAREIHDELGQHLTSLRIRLSLLASRNRDDSEPMTTLIDQIDNTIRVVRNVATQLRPAVLNMGLVPALRWLVEEFNQLGDCHCQLRCAKANVVLSDSDITMLFRIVQESLTNIRRHAQATKASVTLTTQGENLAISIRDNGCGFAPDNPRDDAFGLFSLRERCAMQDWPLEIVSAPGAGTAINVTVPFLDEN